MIGEKGCLISRVVFRQFLFSPTDGKSGVLIGTRTEVPLPPPSSFLAEYLGCFDPPPLRTLPRFRLLPYKETMFLANREIFDRREEESFFSFTPPSSALVFLFKMRPQAAFFMVHSSYP